MSTWTCSKQLSTTAKSQFESMMIWQETVWSSRWVIFFKSFGHCSEIILLRYIRQSNVRKRSPSKNKLHLVSSLSNTKAAQRNKSKMTMTTITSAPWSMLFNQRSLHLYMLNFFQTHQFISQMTILLSPSSLRSSSSLASLEGWVGGCRRTDGLTPSSR
jgi:hypothetical protein